MPSEVIQVRSTLNLTEITQIFQVSLNGRGVKFGKIKDEDDPFSTMETQPDFSAVASHDKNVGSWAVQLYVYDESGSRLVELHAVYHSGFSRAMAGIRNTYSKSASVKNAQAVIVALREMDHSLIII